MSGLQNIEIRRGVFFNWFSSVLRAGYKGTLDIEDLPPLPRSFDAHTAAKSFVSSARRYIDTYSYSWLDAEQQAKASIRPLVYSILCRHGSSLLKVSVLKALGCLLSFTTPLVLGRLVGYLDSTTQGQEGLQEGLVLVCVLVLLSLVSAVISSNANARSLQIKTSLQASLAYLLYYRALSLPLQALSELSVSEGQVGTLLQVDVDTVSSCLQGINDLWLLPLQIILAFVLLYQQVHVAFLAGVAVIIVMLPLNGIVAQRIGESTRQLMIHKDRRLKILTACLKAAASMKLSGLEYYLLHRSQGERRQEVLWVRARKYYDAWCVFLWAFTPVLVPFATFSTALLLGIEVSGRQAIVTLALLSMLIFPLNALPWVLNGIMEAYVSLQRISRLLNSCSNKKMCVVRG
ncbi:hypothetical protein EON64_16925, partial [archaeon]